MERKSSVKLDLLRSIELGVQKFWDGLHVFEPDALSKDEDSSKFMATFPYPYMNGRLHLGHSFSLSKCEFAIGFERLKGVRTLFPFGLHCTGMPIKACADKLKAEIETYGYPPKFDEDDSNKTPNPDIKVKSKVLAKTGNISRQWNIMKSFGLQDEEIKKFTDPLYWLEYFPKYAIQDLKKFGAKIDWRRSFITTDANPFYDSFIRWQFNHLKHGGYIKFGKRYTIYSPKDKQPCMDHDRLSGEGVGTLEYTVVKLKLELNEKLKSILSKGSHYTGQSVYLLAATLRPETVFGQTNCWVHPEIDYIAFQGKNDQIYIGCQQVARNMAYQELTLNEFKVDQVVSSAIRGTDLIGLRVKAPLSILENIYILPMMTIKADKGTGIVMSVPSDSPDDYACLVDLQKKAPLREKFGVDPSMLNEPIPIISLPNYGELSAKAIYEELKISSQNDSVKLLQAKETIYRSAFYEGKMIVDNIEYKDLPVQEAKKIVQCKLIQSNDAFIYQEPESKIISRSGDECVVALCDQWYLNYGEPEWKATTEKCLENLETYSNETRNYFNSTLDWLHEHACARSFGLGTKLPWDPQYLIESLSDSTIYMAYYTVAHYLQGGTLNGRNCSNTLNIVPEQMTQAVWDYIFFKNVPFPESTNIEQWKLELLRNEFQYWYPVDLRVSGKDLVPNHLTFYLYNHVAMWKNEPENWPKSIRANGHLLLNSEKMSKSTGNFMTLSGAIDKFGADGVRFALADSGDTFEDANFIEKTADSGVLRLYNLLQWCKDMLHSLKLIDQSEQLSDKLNALDLYSSNQSDLMSIDCTPLQPAKNTSDTQINDRTVNLVCDPSAYGIYDKIFDNEINRAALITYQHYHNMLYREGLKAAFFDLQNAKDFYIMMTPTDMINPYLICKFIYYQALLLSPICPHVCEYIYQMIRQIPDFPFECHSYTLMNCEWPNIKQGYNNQLSKVYKYVQTNCHNFRLKMRQRKQQQIAAATVYFSDEYVAWQRAILVYLRDFAGLSDDPTIETVKFPESKVFMSKLKEIVPNFDPKANNKYMSFYKFVQTRTAEEGVSSLDLKMDFNEKELLESLVDYLKKTLNISDIAINSSVDAKDNIKEQCSPGNPIIFFS